MELIRTWKCEYCGATFTDKRYEEGLAHEKTCPKAARDRTRLIGLSLDYRLSLSVYSDRVGRGKRTMALLYDGCEQPFVLYRPWKDRPQDALRLLLPAAEKIYAEQREFLHEMWEQLGRLKEKADAKKWKPEDMKTP